MARTQGHARTAYTRPPVQSDSASSEQILYSTNPNHTSPYLLRPEMVRLKQDTPNSTLNSISDFAKASAIKEPRRILTTPLRAERDDDIKSLSSTLTSDHMSSSLRGTIPACFSCKGRDSLLTNSLVPCKCRRYYHSSCHKPPITVEQQSDKQWRCSACRRKSINKGPPQSVSCLRKVSNAHGSKAEAPTRKKSAICIDLTQEDDASPYSQFYPEPPHKKQKMTNPTNDDDEQLQNYHIKDSFILSDDTPHHHAAAPHLIDEGTNARNKAPSLRQNFVSISPISSSAIALAVETIIKQNLTSTRGLNSNPECDPNSPSKGIQAHGSSCSLRSSSKHTLATARSPQVKPVAFYSSSGEKDGTTRASEELAFAERPEISATRWRSDRSANYSTTLTETDPDAYRSVKDSFGRNALHQPSQPRQSDKSLMQCNDLPLSEPFVDISAEDSSEMLQPSQECLETNENTGTMSDHDPLFNLSEKSKARCAHKLTLLEQGRWKLSRKQFDESFNASAAESLRFLSALLQLEQTVPDLKYWSQVYEHLVEARKPRIGRDSCQNHAINRSWIPSDVVRVITNHTSGDTRTSGPCEQNTSENDHCPAKADLVPGKSAELPQACSIDQSTGCTSTTIQLQIDDGAQEEVHQASAARPRSAMHNTQPVSRHQHIPSEIEPSNEASQELASVSTIEHHTLLVVQRPSERGRSRSSALSSAISMSPIRSVLQPLSKRTRTDGNEANQRQKKRTYQDHIKEAFVRFGKPQLTLNEITDDILGSDYGYAKMGRKNLRKNLQSIFASVKLKQDYIKDGELVSLRSPTRFMPKNSDETKILNHGRTNLSPLPVWKEILRRLEESGDSDLWSDTYFKSQEWQDGGVQRKFECNPSWSDLDDKSEWMSDSGRVLISELCWAKPHGDPIETLVFVDKIKFCKTTAAYHIEVYLFMDKNDIEDYDVDVSGVALNCSHVATTTSRILDTSIVDVRPYVDEVGLSAGFVGHNLHYMVNAFCQPPMMCEIPEECIRPSDERRSHASWFYPLLAQCVEDSSRIEENLMISNTHATSGSTIDQNLTYNGSSEREWSTLGPNILEIPPESNVQPSAAISPMQFSIVEGAMMTLLD